MAFPCNQFGNQEPGTDAEILAFARSHGFPDPTHTAGFRMFAKTHVNGPETVPVWSFLKNSKVGKGHEIRWNYAKFLVGANGVPLKKYEAPFDLKKIARDVEDALQALSDVRAEYDSGF